MNQTCENKLQYFSVTKKRIDDLENEINWKQIFFFKCSFQFIEREDKKRRGDEMKREEDKKRRGDQMKRNVQVAEKAEKKIWIKLYHNKHFYGTFNSNFSLQNKQFHQMKRDKKRR